MPRHLAAAVRREELLDLIRQRGEIAPRDAQEALGISPRLFQQWAKILLAQGAITAAGTTTSRCYRPVLTALSATNNGNAAVPTGKQEPSVKGRLLEALLYHPGSTEDLAKRLNIPADQAETALCEMRDEDEVKRGIGHVWKVTPS
jgi:hypothetical protein